MIEFSPAESRSPEPLKTRWLVVGCVGIGLVVVAFIGVGFYAGMSFLRGEAYEMALDHTRRHPSAVAALGAPIQPGWYVLGRVRMSGSSSGVATLSIPVSGPARSGSLAVLAVQEAGVWELRRLDLTPSGDVPIDLLAPGHEGPGR